MYFDVKGKQVFATTGGKPFDESLPCVIFLHGSGLDHTFWGLHSRFFAFRRYSVLAHFRSLIWQLLLRRLPVSHKPYCIVQTMPSWPVLQ